MEAVMAKDHRALWLANVADRPATGAGRPAKQQRRAVVRRLPLPDDPVDLLQRLDQAPVDDASRAGSRDAEVADHPTRVPRLGRRPRWTTVVAAVVFAAVLAVAGLFGYRWYGDRTLDQAHQRALAAARQESVNFVSVSASSVDRDLQRIVAGAAGQFKDEFVRGQDEVRKAVVENSVQSTGTVLRAGLVSGDRRSAVALVAVDATVKNSKAPDGRTAHYRIQVDLTRDTSSGSWLVSRLQFVG
jgi:Mce-associated membrane protein